jgi:hypothetical protein
VAGLPELPEKTLAFRLAASVVGAVVGEAVEPKEYTTNCACTVVAKARPVSPANRDNGKEGFITHIICK